MHYGTSHPTWMDSESVRPWQGVLAFQRCGRPDEHIPSALASRSPEADHCKDGWKYAWKVKQRRKKKIINQIIIITMVVTAVVARAKMAKEDAEEAEEIAAEEAIAIAII
jgi:hypothetical protein